MPRRTSAALVLALAGAACQSNEPEPPPDRPVGPPIEVELLGGGFVEFEEQRMAVEEFVYEVRLRCRAAAEGTGKPWLRVIAPREERPEIPATVETIRREAWNAGVAHVEFELGEP